VIFPESLTLSQWLQAQLAVNFHELAPLDPRQLDFIARILESPLTEDELRQLFRIAHAACKDENPRLSVRDGKLLLKVLDEQSPKENKGVK
jgi:hypothetical protein